MIRYKFIQKKITYTGKQLTSHWIYKNFEIPGDVIVVFRGPAEVDKYLVDIIDKHKKAYIYSKDMLHFIAEHFSLDLEKAICYQRLLMSIIKDEINSYLNEYRIQRYADDLYDEKDKLSVSIATLTPISTVIHAGINISSKDTPISTKGLQDYNMSNEDIVVLGNNVIKKYSEEIESIYLARCKVRPVH